MAAQPAIIANDVSAAPTVAERCAALGISQSFLSEFLQISKAELSRSLRDGNRPIQIERGLTQLEELVALWHPVPLGFHDADVIRELVRANVVMGEENRERLRGFMEALSGN